MVYKPTAPPATRRLHDDRSRDQLTPSLQKPVTPVTTVTRFHRMSLKEFQAADFVVEVSVPWWPETLWLVPTSSAIDELADRGIERGRVWTAAELIDLHGIGDLSHNDLRAIGLLKESFGIEILRVSDDRSQGGAP